MRTTILGLSALMFLSACSGGDASDAGREAAGTQSTQVAVESYPEAQKCEEARVTNLAFGHTRYGHNVDSSILSQIDENGGSSFDFNYRDGACYMDFAYSGIVDGQSYSKTGTCKVKKFSDTSEGHPRVSEGSDIECSSDY